MKNIIFHFIGFSPVIYVSNKINSRLSRKFRRKKYKDKLKLPPVLIGSSFLPDMPADDNTFPLGSPNNEVCIPNETFFDVLRADVGVDKKPRRISQQELDKLMRSSTIRLTKEQKLLRSLVDDHMARKKIKSLSQEAINNFETEYNLRRRYRLYLRIKRLLPIGITAHFTGLELSKMAAAKVLGATTIPFSLGGVIGLSLPAFYFFHMLSYYVPSPAKPICTVGKVTLGGAYLLLCTCTDEFSESFEEGKYGHSIPLDVMNTGGSLPTNLGDTQALSNYLYYLKVIQDLKNKKLPEELKELKIETFLNMVPSEP